MAENDVDDEFAEAAAIILVGIEAKGKLKIISVTCTPLSGLE